MACAALRVYLKYLLSESCRGLLVRPSKGGPPSSCEAVLSVSAGKAKSLINLVAGQLDGVKPLSNWYRPPSIIVPVVDPDQTPMTHESIWTECLRSLERIDQSFQKMRASEAGCVDQILLAHPNIPDDMKQALPGLWRAAKALTPDTYKNILQPLCHIFGKYKPVPSARMDSVQQNLGLAHSELLTSLLFLATLQGADAGRRRTDECSASRNMPIMPSFTNSYATDVGRQELLGRLPARVDMASGSSSPALNTPMTRTLPLRSTYATRMDDPGHARVRPRQSSANIRLAGDLWGLVQPDRQIGAFSSSRHPSEQPFAGSHQPQAPIFFSFSQPPWLRAICRSRLVWSIISSKYVCSSW